MSHLSPPLPPSSPTKKSSQELPMMPIITQPLTQPDRQPSQSTRGQSEDLDETQVPPLSSQPSDRRAQVKTPEPRIQSIQHAGHNRASGMDDQRSPGHIPDFDWDAFESRYERALSESNEQEKELLEEFDRLVKYFNVWQSAAAAHDNERAVKRLQTRQRYVKLTEENLDAKKQHLTEVVRAFQSALALLGSQG